MRRSIYSIVEVPVDVSFTLFIPILIVEPGIIPVYVLGYLRNLIFLGTEPPTVTKAAHAIGLLLDYYVIEQGAVTLDEYHLRLLINKFYEVRRNGSDKLGWTPVSSHTALKDVEYVSQFSSYCARTYGLIDANPFEKIMVESMSKHEFQTWLKRAQAKKNFDLLMHASPHTESAKGVVSQRQVTPGRKKKIGKAIQPAKQFPPRRVLEFFNASLNVRDKLCWLLMFYGGLRISELMHIYVRDVTLDEKTGMASVVLADPRDGVIRWQTARGAMRTATRAEFLQERYRMPPRTAYPTKHPKRAGWKGVKHDDPSSALSQVYWTDPRMGQLFWELHTEYMRTIRWRVPDNHPYYFVSTKAECFGEPLKIKNLSDQFYANAHRIGLSSAEDGVNPHGGRHFYGFFCANYLRFPKEKTQVMMHHSSMDSTEIYYCLAPETVSKDLAQAYERMMADVPDFLNASTLLHRRIDGA